MIIEQYRSPVGSLWLGVDQQCVCLCDWEQPTNRTTLLQTNNPTVHTLEIKKQRHTPEDIALLAKLITQLDEYFASTRREFDLPIQQPGTPFQFQVWTELQTVKYGRTLTYGELASRLGRPTATRAVANALRRNRISILLPCHRIVAASGHGGYRGGISAKLALLALEADNEFESTFRF